MPPSMLQLWLFCTARRSEGPIVAETSLAEFGCLALRDAGPDNFGIPIELIQIDMVKQIRY